jgi:hypothetical protein
MLVLFALLTSVIGPFVGTRLFKMSMQAKE